MRDDELRGLLRESNPWWLAAGSGGDPVAWAKQDPTLVKRARFDQGYRPAVLADVASSPVADGLYVLRGPRRVGKSVAVKDLVARLCGRPDISPWQVVYFAADNMTDHDLRRAFTLGRDLTRAAGDRPRVWLVDEVTAIAGWTSTIKALRDNSPMAHDTVLLTGSSATSAAAAHRDLGAGRAGENNPNPFRLLLPMSFREFLRTTDPDMPELDAVPPWELQSGAVARVAAEMEPFVDLHDLAWQRYLECGGFPRAVSEYTVTGAVSETFLRDLAAWLRTDVDPDGPQESVPLLLDTVHQRTASPLNLRATAERLGTTRTQLDRRLNRLVHAFGALWCPQRNQHGLRVAGSQSKMYLLDPILAQLAAVLRPGLGHRDFTALSEAALGVALARVIEATAPGRLVDGDSIGYLRTERGGEVDLCAVPIASAYGLRHTTPVESKWVSQGWRAEARVIEAKYGAGIVATKNLIDTTHPAWALPAPLVSLLLGG